MDTPAMPANNERTPNVPSLKRRAGDRSWLCWIALRFTDLWDWIDNRDLDKHAVSICILIGTVKVTSWACVFADAHMDKSGAELAAVIAAVIAPYMALQAAAISFYFKARS